jgi:hypothetical protein
VPGARQTGHTTKLTAVSVIATNKAITAQVEFSDTLETMRRSYTASVQDATLHPKAYHPRESGDPASAAATR